MTYNPRFATDLSDKARNNEVNVEGLNAFPDAVSSIVTFEENITNNVTKPINSNTLQFENNNQAKIISSSEFINNWTTELTGNTPLFTGDIARFVIQDIDFNSATGTSKLFNIVAVTAVRPTVIHQRSIVTDFSSIGTIDGAFSIANNVVFDNCGEGITLNDNNAIFGVGILWNDCNFISQTGDHIILTGNIFNAVFNTIIANPSFGDSLFNISSSMNINERISITDCAFSNANGGTLFDPSGKDQTDPQVIAFNNGNELDSYWIGSLGFENNATVTTVNAIDTYTDITGTIVTNPQNERFTVSGSVLTYIGLENIKGLIQVDITASRDLPASSARTLRVAVFIDSGSGFVEQASASMSISGNRTAFSFVVPTTQANGDQTKVQIKNEDTTDDILVIDYNLTMRKL